MSWPADSRCLLGASSFCGWAVTGVSRACTGLQRRGVRLAVGMSTVHAELHEVPEAYAEAWVARDSLGTRAGVLALPLLSSFDYLVLREDETARRLIRPQMARFVADDAAAGGVPTTTTATGPTRRSAKGLRFASTLSPPTSPPGSSAHEPSAA
jgi:hypothetical protein